MANTIVGDLKEIAQVLDAGGKPYAPIRIHTSESTLKKARPKLSRDEQGNYYIGLHRIEILASLRPGKKKAA